MKRWFQFNAVGAIGVVVQLAALKVLHDALGIEYLLATALAVETAVLHNFAWHELWTWKDRIASRTGILWRLLRFNLSTGLVSILVNLVFMRALVGRFHMRLLIANLLSILASSLVNFFLSDLFVFPTAG